MRLEGERASGGGRRGLRAAAACAAAVLLPLAVEFGPAGAAAAAASPGQGAGGVAGAGAVSRATPPSGSKASSAFLATHADGGIAPATAQTFTWTGTDSTNTTSPDSNWSDPNNWQGGVAPSPSDGPVDLVFPVPTCSPSTTGCGESNNDLTGLVVDQMTVDDTPPSSASTVPLSRFFTGNGITLDGGLSDTFSASSGGGFARDVNPFFELPITLGASQTWTVTGQPHFAAPIAAATGTSARLALSISGGGVVNVSASMDLAGLSVVGTPSVTVNGREYGGQFFLEGNGTTKATTITTPTPVQLTDVIFGATSLPGSPVEAPAFTSTGSLIYTGEIPPDTGTTSAIGPVSLDASSVVSWDLSDASGQNPPVPGSDYPQLASSSTVALGSAAAEIDASCNLAVGTAFRIVSAAGGLTGALTDFSSSGPATPIPNGGVIQAISSSVFSSCQAAGAVAPYLEITYEDGGNGSAGSVTATVVARPSTATTTTALSATPSAPTVGQSVALTAEVATSVSGFFPRGSVAFTADGTAIAGCGAVALSTTSPYTATCKTSFPAPAAVSVRATFTSSSASVTGSSGSTTVAVQAGYLVLTTNGGVHNFHAPWYGSLAGQLGGTSVKAIAADPLTGGYWILTSNGGVHNLDAPWYGSLAGQLPKGVSVAALATD